MDADRQLVLKGVELIRQGLAGARGRSLEQGTSPSLEGAVVLKIDGDFFHAGKPSFHPLIRMHHTMYIYYPVLTNKVAFT